jgi:hypothetical protein
MEAGSIAVRLGAFPSESQRIESVQRPYDFEAQPKGRTATACRVKVPQSDQTTSPPFMRSIDLWTDRKGKQRSAERAGVEGGQLEWVTYRR